MTHVDNHSSFPAELLSLPDLDGQEAQVLIVSATFAELAGELVAAPEQRPIQMADECFGDPETSSVRYESAVYINKARTDVLVNGTAYAPGGRPAEELIAGLQIGSVRKRIRVMGDRFRTAFGPSSPQPFSVMPIVYERAFGGTDSRDPDPRRHQMWRQNPLGVGFNDIGSRSETILTEYPNILPENGSDRDAPAGFGVIGRSWSPRREWAGTFDAQWLENRWPLMPADFDARYNQSAPSDQQLDTISGGEIVQLDNLTPEGQWRFALPSPQIPVWFMFDRGKQPAELRMDTVLIEPDTRTVSLTFRLALTLERGSNRLREIVVGPVTPGVLRAKERRKPYWNLADLRKNESVKT